MKKFAKQTKPHPIDKLYENRVHLSNHISQEGILILIKFCQDVIRSYIFDMRKN